MYTVLMLHLIGEKIRMYLGSVGLVTSLETDDPVAVMEEHWQRFLATKPEHKHMFVEWLVEQNEASEVSYDEESPNVPLQVYLETPHEE